MVERKCSWCGNRYLIKQKDIITDPLKLCSYCRVEVGQCEYCNSLEDNDYLYSISIDGEQQKRCGHCITNDFKQCNFCNQFVLIKDVVAKFPYRRTPDGKLMYKNSCKDCATEEHCSICNEKTHPKLLHDDRNEKMCVSCREHRQTWHTYDYKPLKFIYHTSDKEGKAVKDTFFMGFELELMNKSKNMSTMQIGKVLHNRYSYDRMYVMADGTIKRQTQVNGAEIVSHPFTWLKYKEDLLIWDDLLLFLRANGWRGGHEGIGIHIHTSKAAWGTFQLFKLINFAYNHTEFIEYIAQRPPNNYCSLPEQNYKQHAVIAAKDKKNRDANHYHIINLNNVHGGASDTVEFRMFKSMLEPLYFHKNIEFVHACYRITQEASKITEEVFRNFIDYNRYVYPCLYEFLTKEV